MKNKASRARRLARINRQISRLSSELETLQYLQDRVERGLRPRARGSNKEEE